MRGRCRAKGKGGGYDCGVKWPRRAPEIPLLLQRRHTDEFLPPSYSARELEVIQRVAAIDDDGAQLTQSRDPPKTLEALVPSQGEAGEVRQRLEERKVVDR